MEAKNVWVFQYGNNHPARVAAKLNIPLQKLIKNIRPCRLQNYIKAYHGKSKRYQNSSTCTIFQSDIQDKDSIQGIAYLLTQQSKKLYEQKLDLMDFDQHFLKLNDCSQDNCDKKKKEFKAWVYVQKCVQTFVTPSDQYLIGVAKTNYAHHYLAKTKGFEKRRIKLQVLKYNCHQSLSKYIDLSQSPFNLEELLDK